MGSLTLACTLSVRLASLAATSLPLELQQQIFAFLDEKTFCAARQVCRYWRFAATDAVTLARQLQKLPITPTVEANRTKPRELAQLYDEAAQTLMLGMTVSRQPDLSPQLESDLELRFKGCATSNGTQTVLIDDRVIRLYERTCGTPTLITQRQLNDPKETVGNGPWLKIQPLTTENLALSSSGQLLAIAQDRTIQIYDLLADSESFTVNKYTTWASGHSIRSVAFHENDYLMRVRLHDKGTVIYCGAPCPQDKASDKAGLDHWKSSTGLIHTFLDSSNLIVPRSDVESTSQPARLAGLQLLRQTQSGFLFASQHHGEGRSSHYFLGHVRTHSTSLTADPDSVTILARLDSFLSSIPFTLDCGGAFAGSRGLWENMPSAHEHHPDFALASDNSLVLVAERSKKEIRHRPRMELFIYRLPSSAQIAASLKERWASLSISLAGLEKRQGAGKRGRRRISMKYADFEANERPLAVILTEYKIGRIPICLGMVMGTMSKMKFERVFDEGEGKKYSIEVTGSEGTKRWSLWDV